MKKILLIGICFVFLVACSSNNENIGKSINNENEKTHIENDMPAITGEIVKIENGRFLVESTTEKLPDGRPDAIWFSTNDIESLRVGQLVSVWTNEINESYPAQANADKIEIKE
ncbi:uncharacterized protein DUF3221 [Cytobacillus oceanisediminis]|uniref:Uncharacterized protein DUF3221 n=1 Tax=Cytobacillus oceanisediminis TaxID=665099 RepID=A0A2V3ACK5_9BACI|nr:DUF3221 domain-containing protein [Cytobacillus oceanisediminis]PWW31254.1 uncharacterized protein DUF3221 [Cytobacillus oceanisediminis]